MQRRYFRADFAHAAVLTLSLLASQPLVAQEADAPAETIEFSSQATALPFPPDARELEFDATFDGIEYKSGSSLDSLAAFYRREMTKRGWTEDAESFERDEETITLVFEHDARVEIELDQYSDEVVSVELDCEGLEFDGVDDPATLIAAGIPQPRAYVFLQKEIPRPEEYQDVFYRSGSCHFKAPLELQAAFDFYNKALKGAGWKEIRKPIVDSDRRYTEFRKNGITVSVNIFSDDVGARIILGYENPSKEKVVPPLPRVAASTPLTPDGEPAPEGDPASGGSTAKTSVDVSKNKGTATITLGAEKYVFKFAAAFRNKEDGEEKTKLIFSDRPIPLPKLQAMLAKDDDLRFGDLFEFESPGQLTIEFGQYVGISFNAGGVGIGNSIEASDCDLKFENGRATGTVKMAEALEFFDDKFHIYATIDAAILTPNTQLGGAAAEEEITARESAFPGSDSDLLLPSDASNVNGGGSRYSRSTHAVSDAAIVPLVKFYRKELAAQGWKESGAKNVAANAGNATLKFAKEGAKLTVAMTRNGEQTTLDVSSSDDARAKEDGVLPEPGKGRIVLANASTENIVIAIGKKDYPLKAGQGEADPKEALNYSVVPGKYKITVKFPGKSPQTETIEITAGATWGLFALPAGDYITNQLYGGSSKNE
jgi:hypothetical protein